MEKTIAIKDDGLITPEIGAWGEEKHRLVAFYASLFAKSMKKKWESLVYVDLFAGAGRARIRNTKRIVNASPLIVLDLPEKFDRYIFCDKEISNCKALIQRIQREFPEKCTNVICGDTNQKVDEIFQCMPSFGKNFRVLAFCFIDPFALSNLHFETIHKLSKRLVDFLVLIPSGMDAHRFVAKYLKTPNSPVDFFLGNSEWRASWQEAQQQKKPFEIFIVEEFGKAMGKLHYLSPSLEDTKLIRSDENNLPLYRLVLYSRHELGGEFWRQAKKYSQAQQEMF